MGLEDVRRWIAAVNGTHSAEVMEKRNAAVAVAAAAAKEAEAGSEVEEEGARELKAVIAEWQAAGYRGSEFRHALSLLHEKQVGGLAEGVLCSADLLEIYRTVVEEGKFWSVEHDVAKLGVWAPQQGAADAAAAADDELSRAAPTPSPPPPPFEATFDYIYYSDADLELRAVREPLTAAQKAEVLEQGTRFPCEWHMSDHLPVAASFKFR
jgi:hypothetical protein